MNNFFKQATRKPVFTVLMALLLTLSIALSCIGCSAWVGASAQKEQILGSYTTIAVLQQVTFDPSKGEAADAEKIALMQNRVRAYWAAQEAPQLKKLEQHGLLSAHIAGSKSLSSSRIDPAEYNIAFDGKCYNLAVFALRCESVEDPPETYSATFQVEEIVSLSDAYDCFPTPDSLMVVSHLRLADGTCPFEAGKRYLVFGGYQDYDVYATADGYKQIGKEDRRNRYLTPFPWIVYDPDSPILETGEIGGFPYYYLMEGQTPWFAELTGSVEDYLASEEGTVWSDTILPLCRLNQESAGVILTDNASSLYSFNTGDTSLLSGRLLSQEEYESGADVCMVSAAYAQANGLELGDKLELELYDSGFMEYTNGASANSYYLTPDPGPYRQRCCMFPEDAIGVCKEYTIVGIYTGPRFVFGSYYFNADTILIPKASVPNGENYISNVNSLLNSFVLENGSVEDFEAYMTEQGYGGLFLYFDQGFSKAEASLEAMETNALRLLFVGMAAFLLTAALFLFLNFRRMKPAAGNMRRLGVKRKTVFAQEFGTMAVLIAISVALGAALGAALYGVVTAQVLSETVALRPLALLACAGMQLALLLLAAALWAETVARRNPMNSNQRET